MVSIYLDIELFVIENRSDFCQMKNRHLLSKMNSSDAKLYQINTFLGGGIDDILQNPNCKLFFESNAEARKGNKIKKPCIVYLVHDALLICRPRKYSKKYYIKFHLSIDSLILNISESTPYGHDCNLIVAIQNKQYYSIWYHLFVQSSIGFPVHLSNLPFPVVSMKQKSICVILIL